MFKNYVLPIISSEVLVNLPKQFQSNCKVLVNQMFENTFLRAYPVELQRIEKPVLYCSISCSVAFSRPSLFSVTSYPCHCVVLTEIL